MADLLSSYQPLQVGRQAFDAMHESNDGRWQQQSNDHFFSGQWPSDDASTMQHLQALGNRVSSPTNVNLVPHLGWDQGHILSPSVEYHHGAWVPDMDMEGTACPAAFSTRMDVAPNPQHIALSHRPTTGSHRGSCSIHSPHTSQSGLSPRLAQPNPPESINPNHKFPQNPTAHPYEREARLTANTSSTLKRETYSDEDDEIQPTNEDAKARGRKRQRIPHTAVERRYRENLNAHLEKLRQTVPTLASRRPPGVEKTGDRSSAENAKPSKCEILNGAIEHIGELNRRNSILENEVTTLRAKLAEMERWYHKVPH